MKIRISLASGVFFILSCGGEEYRSIKNSNVQGGKDTKTIYTYSLPNSEDLHADVDDEEENVRIIEHAFAKENILASFIVPIKSGGGLSLAESELSAQKDILACVGINKYMNVTGELSIPMIPEDYGLVDIGCLDVTMHDNLYYLQETKLVAVTGGIRGEFFDQIVIPLKINVDGWQEVPTDPDFFTVETFAQNTIKHTTRKLCFQLEFWEVPAQVYSGEILLHYLKPDGTPNYEEEFEKQCNFAASMD